jgi:DNA-binding response OmpR family regulator
MVENTVDVSGQAASKKILIVEDDKFLRELIVRKLLGEGYNVVEAVDGEEAIIKIKENKPDLILLDLILPGADGFEVLSKTKADPLVASIPVIVLSNLGQKEDVERGLKLGAVDYLIKAHFTPGEIVEKIKIILK